MIVHYLSTWTGTVKLARIGAGVDLLLQANLAMAKCKAWFTICCKDLRRNVTLLL